MYRLKFLSNEKLYQIHSQKDGAFEGNLETIKKKALEIGLKESEFEMAIDEMGKNNHNIAEFGFFGSFIYTE